MFPLRNHHIVQARDILFRVTHSSIMEGGQQRITKIEGKITKLPSTRFRRVLAINNHFGGDHSKLSDSAIDCMFMDLLRRTPQVKSLLERIRVIERELKELLRKLALVTIPRASTFSHEEKVALIEQWTGHNHSKMAKGVVKKIFADLYIKQNARVDAKEVARLRNATKKLKIEKEELKKTAI